MKEIISRSGTLVMLTCAMTLLLAGCSSRAGARSISDSRFAHQPVKADSLSDYIRGIYKVSSEASRHAEQRTALLSSAPELAELLDRAEHDPMDREARSRIVTEYLSRELYWGAYDLLTNTIVDHGSDPDANLSFAVIWDAWDQYSLALQYGERAIANGAKSAKAFETLGRIHLHLNEPDAAIAWYNRSLEYGRTAPILANVGYARMLTSEWDQAKVNLEEAVALDDTLEVAHNNLAVVLSKIGDDTGALAHLLKTSRPAVAFNNMGVLYLQTSDLQNAQHYFEEALRLEPDYELARRNLDALQALLAPLPIIDLPALPQVPENSSSPAAL
jgi:tetratricopeptide (TPR) repeat protein